MRYAVIGTGNISRTWIRALSSLGLPVCCCVSRSGRSPEDAVGLPVFASIKEASKSAEFDAIVVTTPNGLHRESVIEAARLGKHVLTEKPLDIELAAMDAMIQAAREAGITLAVCYQRRTNPDNLALKRLFDEGAFGRVFAADLSCKFWRDAAYYASAPYRGGYSLDGGGPFMQQACHNIDLYRWFFGMPVEVKSSLANLFHDIETEDHGAAILRHSNGMIGTIVASTLARPGLPARLEVHAERGTFVTLDDRITLWRIDGIDNPAAPQPPAEGAAPAGSQNSFSITDTSRHEAIIRDFEDAVAHGRPPLVTADSARDTTALILQIYKERPIRAAR